MPKIPGVQRIGYGAASQTAVPRPVPPPDLASIDTGGRALAQGLEAMAQAIASEAKRQANARLNVELTQLQTQAEAMLYGIGQNFENDTDFKTAGQRWDDVVREGRGKFLQGIDNPQLRELLAADYDSLAQRHKRQFHNQMAEREGAFRQQEWETQRNVLVNGYATAPDDTTRLEQQDFALRQINAVGEGWAGPAWAEKERARFLQDGQALQVTNLIRRDPAAAKAALQDPEQFKALPPMKRVQLSDQAQAWQEDLLREQERQAARLEREHQQAQEDNALGAFAGLVNGRYSLADLKRDVAARKFSLSDARSLHRLLIEEQPGSSNPNTRLALVDSMTQGQDVRGAVLSAVQAGELTAGDAMQLLERNRAVQRQEGPFSSAEFREAKDLLGRTFGQGGNQFDYTRQDRFAQALDELQQVSMEKGATAALPAARKILARELERGIARPAGYVGEMNTRGLEDYRGRLAREFAALPPDEQAKQAPRYNGQLAQIEQAMTALGRIEDIKQSFVNGGK